MPPSIPRRGPAIPLPPLPAPRRQSNVIPFRPDATVVCAAPVFEPELEIEGPTIAVPRVPMPPPAPPPPAPAPPVRVTTSDRWAIFEQLGLGRPKQSPQQKRAQMIVSTYRGLGFAVLSLIVVILVGYIATSAFYFVDDTWIEPMVVSPTDERVVTVQAQVAAAENERDRILADLAHQDRYIAVQETYQAEFVAAIKADLSGRKAELDRVRALARGYAGARARVQASNSAYAAMSRKQMAEEYAAGLIDRSGMLSGKYQLAQITTSNLGLAERQAEYENRATELDAEASSLDAIVSQKGGDAALSYGVLKIKQEYEMSRLETTRAIESRAALKSSLTRQEGILAGLERSPYLRAVTEHADVAFVPYGNLGHVKAGTAIYRCSFEMLWCAKAGKVLEVLDGEVSFKHPHRDKMLRGKMVSLALTDHGAAQDDVLFVGGKPLGI